MDPQSGEDRKGQERVKAWGGNAPYQQAAATHEQSWDKHSSPACSQQPTAADAGQANGRESLYDSQIQNWSKISTQQLKFCNKLWPRVNIGHWKAELS